MHFMEFYILILCELFYHCQRYYKSGGIIDCTDYNGYIYCSFDFLYEL